MVEYTARDELASKLNGREYREEITKEEEAWAKQNRLLVVFGASDDLIEFRGLINDESGAPGAIELHRNARGWGVVNFNDEDEPLEPRDFWINTESGESGWTFELPPSCVAARFAIVEDGDAYGEGLVIHEDDLREFVAGQFVEKIGDYTLKGNVLASFTMSSGVIRYAVEHKAEGGGAFVHIYSGKNLIAADPLPAATQER